MSLIRLCYTPEEEDEEEEEAPLEVFLFLTFA